MGHSKTTDVLVKWGTGDLPRGQGPWKNKKLSLIISPHFCILNFLIEKKGAFVPRLPWSLAMNLCEDCSIRLYLPIDRQDRPWLVY